LRVLHALLVSTRSRNKPRFTGAGVVSLVVHVAVIIGATAATWSVGRSDTKIVVVWDSLDSYQPAEGPPAADPLPFELPPDLTDPVVVTEMLPRIEPMELHPTFRAQVLSRSGIGGVVGDDSGMSTPLYREEIVDERPEMLSHPPLDYPEALRRAGVEGRVMILAVVDTTGRAIPSSVTVSESTDHEFDRPAEQLVRGALFRPGRVGGRPVSVLLSIPVVFTLRGFVRAAAPVTHRGPSRLYLDRWRRSREPGRGRLLIEVVVDLSGRGVPIAVRTTDSTEAARDEGFRPWRRAVGVLFSLPVVVTLQGPPL